MGYDSLIDLFYEHAAVDVRAHGVWVLWRVLENDKPDSQSELWKRMHGLWEVRAQVATESADLEKFAAELSAFAWWLPAVPDDLPDIYELVEVVIRFLDSGSHGKDVLEYLAAKASNYPGLSARLLRSMVQSAPDDWYLRRDGLVRQILLTAVSSGDTEAREVGRETINMFGELGDYSHQDLLDV